jgi:hypothetical protein
MNTSLIDVAILIDRAISILFTSFFWPKVSSLSEKRPITMDS